MGEDVAALLGLSFALISVILTMVTGNPVFDAIGSIGIGVLPCCSIDFPGCKIEGLLVGQSVDPEVQKEITFFLEAQPEVEKVLNLITIQLGEKILVAVEER